MPTKCAQAQETLTYAPAECFSGTEACVPSVAAGVAGAAAVLEATH